jgi:lipoprotein signal peptidase
VFLLDSVTKWLVSTSVQGLLRVAQSPLIILPGFANRGIHASARAEHYLLFGVIAGMFAIVWAWVRWPNRWTWMTVGALIVFLCSTLTEWFHAGQWTWARPSMAGRLLASTLLMWEWYRQTGWERGKTAVALGLVAGGTLSNLWDLIRWNGGVPDFIVLRLDQIHVFAGPCNVADLGIVVGGLMLIGQLSARRGSR